MVTDSDGTEITEGDLVEAYEYGEPFPARIESVESVCGKYEVTLRRLDTGEEVTRWNDAVTKFEESST